MIPKVVLILFESSNLEFLVVNKFEVKTYCQYNEAISIFLEPEVLELFQKHENYQIFLCKGVMQSLKYKFIISIS